VAAALLHLAEDLGDIGDPGDEDWALVQFFTVDQRAVRPGLALFAGPDKPVWFLAEAGDLPAKHVVVEGGGALRVIDGNLEMHDL
jgi:hypothetical protein